MRNIIVFIGLLLSCGSSCLVASTNLFSVPFILVTPRSANFGAVPSGKAVTNTFLVENIGTGKLVGSATVAPPFKVVSGGDYSLRYGSAQIVIITYTPSGATLDEQTIKFTGGLGMKVKVVGRQVPPRWPPNVR